jgi:hypothetical protein
MEIKENYIHEVLLCSSKSKSRLSNIEEYSHNRGMIFEEMPGD